MIIAGLAAVVAGLFLITPARMASFANDGSISTESTYFLWLFRMIVMHAGALAVLGGVYMTRGRADDAKAVETRSPGVDLFIVSFLILFMELAFIRWIPAYPRLMAYFTNFILLACFLGMGLGCLAEKSKINYLRAVPFLIVVTTLVTLLIFTLYNLNIFTYSMTNYSRSEVIYFGGVNVSNMARFRNIGIGFIIGIVFISVTLTFIGPGQLMGRLFERFENPVSAYCVNVGASIAGIVAISILSFLQMPAWVWFLVVFVLLAYLLIKDGTPKPLAQACMLLLALSAMFLVNLDSNIGKTSWSPYYKIFYDYPVITVNGIGHQAMESAHDEFNFNYSIAYLLERDTTGGKFDDILVIGAGSGNDVSHALKYGAKNIDAVEIDPVIMKLGRQDHPDRPYDDPRVHVINDDGRSYLHGTDKKYDMIVYALVDSLTLMSNFSSVRLESFLFTEEAFRDIRDHLNPGGVFVMYNLYREPWLVNRLYRMVEKSFGDEPVLMLFHRKGSASTETIKTLNADSVFSGMSVFIAGDNAAMKDAFREYGNYSILEDTRDFRYDFNGFDPPADRSTIRIYNAGFSGFTDTEIPRDNWPFVYLKHRRIPSHNVIGLLLMAGVSFVFISGFMGFRGLPKISMHYFFLGGAFMLIETESIIKLALIHGSTWFVNSVVFGSVLVMIFLANIFVLRRPIRSSLVVYILLFASLAANYFIPLEVFLGKSWFVENLLSSLLLFVPITFAGVIFANSFRKSQRAALDYGSNLLGIIVGGIVEYTSLVYGYNALILFAAAMYAVSLVALPRQSKSA